MLFKVSSNGYTTTVEAKDWYEAIQIAYEKYREEYICDNKVYYGEFRSYCRVIEVEK